MGINFNDSLGVHEQALKLRTQRAQVLANNLANADTPNYKARDLDFKRIMQGDFDSFKSSSSMKMTSEKHLPGNSSSLNTNLMYRIPIQPSIDGNTVEEQVEHAAYMENNMAFQASFTFLNSKFKGLLTALKGE